MNDDDDKKVPLDLHAALELLRKWRDEWPEIDAILKLSARRKAERQAAKHARFGEDAAGLYGWGPGEIIPLEENREGTAVNVKTAPVIPPMTLSQWHALHQKHGRTWKDVAIGAYHIYRCSCGERAFVTEDAMRANRDDPALAATKSG